MKIALYIIMIILILGVIGARYAGLFEKVSVGDGQEKGYTIAGLEFTGPYEQVGPTLERVDQVFTDLNITPQLGFGVYYNDPKTTPKEELKSYVGKIVEKGHLHQLDNMKAAGLKVDSIPASKIITTEIPIRSQFSYMTGAMKAYPALGKYLEEKGYEATFPPYEIYDETNKRILYVMQVK